MTASNHDAARAMSAIFGSRETQEALEASADADKRVRRTQAANALDGVYVPRGPDGFRVVLPNQHSGLARLFEGSQWRTEAGATGGWAHG